MNLVPDLVKGMPIVGDIPLSNVFPARDVIPEPVALESLMRDARGLRARLLRSVGPSGDSSIDEAIWQGSMKEVEQGTMLGPLSLEEAEVRFGPLFLPARRFCIVQGTREVLLPDGSAGVEPKYRLIDDFSEVGHNAAANIRENIVVDDVDFIVVAARRLGAALQQVSGTPSEHRVVGFVEDLCSAYRQVPRRESQRAFFTVACWHPEWKAPCILEHLAQPFGAAAAVQKKPKVCRA